MDQDEQLTTPVSAGAHHIQKRDDAQVQVEIANLIKHAEETRLRYMNERRKRGFVSLVASLIALLAGAAGFGWFFLMKYDVLSAISCIAAALVVPALLNLWAAGPVKAYKNSYKSDFMPEMAKALGGLKFHPARGISAKIINKTGVIPGHDSYQAEDCFMGVYKGVKILLSEARLYKKKKPVFDGLFVLLETPNDVIEGHSIITADHEKATKWAATRWSKLQKTEIPVSNPDWGRFEVYSSQPESARLLIGDRLLKELTEAASIFDDSAMSTVLFAKKYIFMAIPFEQNMFEASNMYVPVTTNHHAMKCKSEIEKILEIVDVFELYTSGDKKQP